MTSRFLNGQFVCHRSEKIEETNRYRSALFNELYFVADGSVSWLEYEESQKVKIRKRAS